MRQRLVIGLAVSLAAVLGLVVILLVRDSSGSAGTYTGSIPPEGISLPEFELPDQGGGTVRTADLEGHVVLVTFLDTQCQAECPIVASLLGDGLRRLDPDDRERVTAIALSADPPEDTPESVAAFLERHQATGLVRYLVAPVERMRPVWNAFAVTPSFDTGIDDLHSIPVRIYAPDGAWVSTLNAGVDLTPENIEHDVEAALRT